MQAEENADTGMPPEEACRQARLALGNPRAVVENVRDQEFITMLESWYGDFVLGIRALRSFPAADPERLARLNLVSGAEPMTGSFIPYRTIQQLRQQRSYEDISAWSIGSITIEDTEGALRQYPAALLSGNAFEVLGMKPYRGRLIADGDDVRGGPPAGWAAVLSYGFWLDRFAGDPQIIGKPIKVSNTAVTIVGVAPPEFQGVWPGVDPELYLPIQFLTVLAGRDALNPPTSFVICSAIGRLKSGVTFDRANAARTGLPTFFGRGVYGSFCI